MKIKEKYVLSYISFLLPSPASTREAVWEIWTPSKMATKQVEPVTIISLRKLSLGAPESQPKGKMIYKSLTLEMLLNSTPFPISTSFYNNGLVFQHPLGWALVHTHFPPMEAVLFDRGTQEFKILASVIVDRLKWPMHMESCYSRDWNAWPTWL